MYIEYNGGICPGNFVQGDFVRGDFVLGGILSRGILSGGFCPGGFVRGDFVLEPTELSLSRFATYCHIFSGSKPTLISNLSLYRIVRTDFNVT